MRQRPSAAHIPTEPPVGNDGFTLIELLIVIVVLGILAAVVVFSLGGVATSASVAACQSDVKTIETAIAAYNAQTGGTPVVTTSLLTSGSHPYVTSWSSNSG
ncbi:MAG: prepilin-type N-terminal cleavage/methylation domain-containing protein, partial [Acidobacteria bacterium]|nr:prepilin-type N-terminal cleavage/methylation domain-containing protein [Acidobacteriota bacterium]